MVDGRFESGTSAIADEVNDATGMVLVEAGENISAGDVVYIHLTDGKAYISDTGTANDIRADGIALTTALSTEDVEVLTRGVFTTSGLTDKEDYYLGASGAISTTRSGVRVGTALSTTELYVKIVQDDKDAIGTIKPYLASFTGIPSNNLTAFWVLCDGTSLSDAESPLNGQTIPDLNGTNYFIRAGDTSGSTGGSATHSHTITKTGTGNQTTYGNDDLETSSESNLPPYYQAVFIMKVK